MSRSGSRMTMPSARPRGMMVALCTGSDAGMMQRHQRVPALVIGGQRLLLLGHHHGAALGAHHDLVLGVLELELGHQALGAARGEQRRLVDQIGEIGAGEAGRAAGDDAQIDVGRERHFPHMHLQDLLAADDVGPRHHHLAVEAAGTQQRGIEHVGTVGRGNQNDAFIGLEAVHLDQQLIQRLLALVVAAAEARAAMAADRVDLVDEDDAGRVLLRLIEHVAHAADAPTPTNISTKSEPEMVKNGTLASPAMARASSVLPVPGGPTKQRAARDAPAELLEFLRVAQELDDLLQIFLGLVDAGDVVEGHAAMPLGEQLGLGLAEAHGAPAARLHLAHEENPHRDQQQHGEPRHQHAEQRRHVVLRRLGGDLHALLVQLVDQVRIVRRIGLEIAAVGEMAGDGVAGDGHILDVAALDLGQQLREADLVAADMDAGLWNRLNSATSRRPMNTQMAKLRKFEFMY